MVKILRTLFFSLSILGANASVELAIDGALDDDLFVIKSDFNRSLLVDCLQMHNPNDYFFYDGNLVKSRKIYGTIDFKKHYVLQESQILLVLSANEREEINPLAILSQRTHFKSAALYVNKTVLIPSLLPENGDVPNYPLWFGDGEKPLLQEEKKEYNYYKLWENAIVNLGIVFGKGGRYRLSFIDREGKSLFQREIEVSQQVQNIKLLGSHPLVEVDGRVYDGTENSLQQVRENAIFGVVIETKNRSVYIAMPYAFVYPNRIFVKGVFGE